LNERNESSQKLVALIGQGRQQGHRSFSFFEKRL
jgi:hypothetical protein